MSDSKNDRDTAGRFVTGNLGKPCGTRHVTTQAVLVLHLSDGARQLLSVYSDEVELAQRPNQPYRNITGFASKSAEQAARLAGVLTLWLDLHAQEVTAETMQNGITLARYYLAEANRLISGGLVDDAIDCAEKLSV